MLGCVDARGRACPGLQRGEELLLRYRYNDRSIQAAMPMQVVLDDPELTVAWLAPETSIMSWATVDGLEPRGIPLNRRFEQPLSTAPRTWRGNGVLRVMPAGLPYQVIHFWDHAHSFAGWYVNFEAPRSRIGACIDTVDWHLDLWIAANGKPRWNDEDEAQAALGTDHLRAADLQTARAAGQSVIDDIQTWPQQIDEWRSFRPDPAWKTRCYPPTGQRALASRSAIGLRDSLLAPSAVDCCTRRSLAGASSDGSDVDEVLDSGKVGRVARIQACRMGVRCSSDQEVHHARSRLATRRRDRCCKLAVAGRDFLVDGKRVESALEVRQSTQAFGTDCSVGGDEDAEVQFGERGGTDRQLSVQPRYVGGD